MEQVNRMGLRVAAMTTVVLVVLFGLYWGGRALLRENNGRDAPDATLSDIEGAGDNDGDGVANLYEVNFYGTDPNVADTDGDGVSDLDEILAGRDPLVAGPDDSKSVPVGADVGSTATFTQRYLTSLPADTSRDDILNQESLVAFVEANKGELLPTIPAGVVKTSEEVGAEAVGTYLDAISSVQNSELTVITSADIEAAFRLQVDTANRQAMQDIVEALTKNVEVLASVVAPDEVTALHTKLVAASQSLKDNSELLLDVQQDFVGGLIGARNIETLGSIFQELAEEILVLETKYGLG